MAKKIVLVSSGQPSLNPRLVKEADALSSAGYEVTVLYAYWNEWGTIYDEQLLLSKQWTAIRIGGSPGHNRITYYLSKLIYTLSRLAFKKNIATIFIPEDAVARSSFFLMRGVKKNKADLYIAHNLGALPAVVFAAKKNNKPCGFDAEDFHRYETSNDNNDQDVVLKTLIENKYIPQVNYLTASSPQIAQAYQQLFPLLKPVTILNVFTKSTFTKSHTVNTQLKLFWFSQTIGPNRGIEDIAKALKLLNKPDIELHLLGNQPAYSKNFINEISKGEINISFHAPISSDDIINFASQFDLGLALETHQPVNRDICLTNKIFTYLQAGLAIVASDTKAQRELLNKNPGIGRVYPQGNAQALADILLDYYQNRTLLIAAQNEALRLARAQYNWEVESLKFLDVVKNTLSV
jgi:glycosyltransferase involved in cell wall biosynthesis